ncbi:MAG TPA: hypothetical protein DDW20_06375 [Firmicutes bacterium]|nr:hypothetical protein [Bacillota bacterium]
MEKVLAFDIGGTNIRIAKINKDLKIEKIEKVSTPRNDVNAFFDAIDNLLKHFDLSDVSAIGAGVPGVVDRENGVIIDLPNVGIKNIEFRKHFLEKYNLQTFIRNDAEVACLAESYAGKGKDYERVFFITISTGLGGAMCINNVNQDYITEIGHTAYKYKDIISEYEYLSCGTGLVHLASLNGLNIKCAKEFFELLDKKDEKALLVKNEWLKILTDFLNLIENSYMPEIYCVTGGVMKSKKYFFEDLKEKNKDKNIVECYFEEDAGIIGAAIYAFKMLKIV